MSSSLALSADAKTTAASAALACSHCGLSVPPFRAVGKSAQDTVFCCEGCKTVYQIITGNNLEEYYAIKKQSDFFANRKPATPLISHYNYLDKRSAKEKFAYSPGSQCMDFYIESVHCVA